MKVKKQFEQVKINVPKTNRRLIDYCRQLSKARKLSARVIRLLTEDMNKLRKDEQDA